MIPEVDENGNLPKKETGFLTQICRDETRIYPETRFLKETGRSFRKDLTRI
ncbi:hypothetical protein [[Phormidium] sp. ETS-05]|uniref:hypothetical protein n=1 Tax=[Phormidium] sp. ETS-05 TaxID=222819 RepID=UPI0018EF2DB4|nr:hypothetical protein [[Phormidium] sp. ETS-05]